MEAEAPDSSPIKSVSGELEKLRTEFRAALETYAEDVGLDVRRFRAALAGGGREG